MRAQRERRLKDNLITGVGMLLGYLLINLAAPAMEMRWKLLVALLAGFVTAAVIYVVKKKKKEKEDEEKLPPL